jgi:YidC/Oxa1 family membrane protein insertase
VISPIAHAVFAPLFYAVSGVLAATYRLFNGGLGMSTGASWALAIVGLTVAVRTALFPLVLKQIRNSRELQALQPRLAELRARYGDDPERLNREIRRLYQETGINPLASCLPLLLQMPIFLALFHTLNRATHGDGVGFMSDRLATSLADNPIFDHVLESDSFTGTGVSTTSRWVTAALVVAMTATTFTTQRQLTRKNMPESALTGQYAQQQKVLLYVLPVVFAVGGIAFPIGVLLYWTTSNLWTMVQQFYVIRNEATPGAPAFDALRARAHDAHAGWLSDLLGHRAIWPVATISIIVAILILIAIV